MGRASGGPGVEDMLEVDGKGHEAVDGKCDVEAKEKVETRVEVENGREI